MDEPPKLLRFLEKVTLEGWIDKAYAFAAILAQLSPLCDTFGEFGEKISHDVTFCFEAAES